MPDRTASTQNNCQSLEGRTGKMRRLRAHVPSEVRAPGFLTENRGCALISANFGASLQETQGRALENASPQPSANPFPQLTGICEFRLKYVPLNFMQENHQITAKRVRTLDFPSGIQGRALCIVLTRKGKRSTPTKLGHRTWLTDPEKTASSISAVSPANSKCSATKSYLREAPMSTRESPRSRQAKSSVLQFWSIEGGSKSARKQDGLWALGKTSTRRRAPTSYRGRTFPTAPANGTGRPYAISPNCSQARTSPSCANKRRHRLRANVLVNQMARALRGMRLWPTSEAERKLEERECVYLFAETSIASYLFCVKNNLLHE